MENKKIEVKPTQTLEEFEDLLEKYKKSNPAKYAIKKAKGEFEAYRKKLGGVIPEVSPEKTDTPEFMLDVTPENTQEPERPKRGRPAVIK